MKRYLGRIVATAALASVCLAVLAVIATAHTVNYDSTISGHFKRGHGSDADVFSGQVASTKATCLHRRVKLLQRQQNAPNLLMGTDRSDKTGNWEIDLAPAPNGTYFAKATKRVLRDTPNHLHVCNPSLSKDIKVKNKP
jgi:hypothetical protein